MSEKLHLVLRKVTEVLTEEYAELEQPVAPLPIVLQVGHDPELDRFLREGRDAGKLKLFTELTMDEDGFVPDVIVFSGTMIGMDAGLEFINDTTVVIVEENESGSLKRRNTAPIHNRAGNFSDWVYLDKENPTIIVYSDYKSVIQEVSKPLQTFTANTDPLSNYDPMNIPPSDFGGPFLSRGGEVFSQSDNDLREGLGLSEDDFPGSGV